MAFEIIKSEINFLLSKLGEAAAPDRQELEFRLREKLNELRAFGMPLPDDLVALEQALDQQMEEDAARSGKETPDER